MRKSRTITSSRIRSMILSGSKLPEITTVDETIVAQAVRKVKSRHKRAYDALHDRAHSEIAAGQFSTLTTYRARRGRKAK